jgi:hypothetical protein
MASNLGFMFSLTGPSYTQSHDYALSLRLLWSRIIYRWLQYRYIAFVFARLTTRYRRTEPCMTNLELKEGLQYRVPKMFSRVTIICLLHHHCLLKIRQISKAYIRSSADFWGIYGICYNSFVLLQAFQPL